MVQDKSEQRTAFILCSPQIRADERRRSSIAFLGLSASPISRSVARGGQADIRNVRNAKGVRINRSVPMFVKQLVASNVSNLQSPSSPLDQMRFQTTCLGTGNPCQFTLFAATAQAQGG